MDRALPHAREIALATLVGVLVALSPLTPDDLIPSIGAGLLAGLLLLAYRLYHRKAPDSGEESTLSAPERAAAPGRLTVLWDASGSREKSDHARELKFLRTYLESALEMRPDVQVRLVIFRDRAADPQRIDLSAAKLDELIARLAGIDYDGGTQMGSIGPFVRDTDLVLLFTDGISTFGVSDPGGLAAPVYVFNSSTMSDGSFMTSLARRTGGRMHEVDADQLAIPSLPVILESFEPQDALDCDLMYVGEVYPEMLDLSHRIFG